MTLSKSQEWIVSTPLDTRRGRTLSRRTLVSAILSVGAPRHKERIADTLPLSSVWAPLDTLQGDVGMDGWWCGTGRRERLLGRDGEIVRGREGEMERG